MTTVCQLCRKPLSSMHVENEAAIPDLLNILTSHLQHRHPVEYREVEEDLKDLQQLLTATPAYLLLRFADIEDNRTSDGFRQMVNAVEKAMEHFSELLFGPGEEEAGEALEEYEPILGENSCVGKS